MLCQLSHLIAVHLLNDFPPFSLSLIDAKYDASFPLFFNLLDGCIVWCCGCHTVELAKPLAIANVQQCDGSPQLFTSLLFCLLPFSTWFGFLFLIPLNVRSLYLFRLIICFYFFPICQKCWSGYKNWWKLWRRRVTFLRCRMIESLCIYTLACNSKTCSILRKTINAGLRALVFTVNSVHFCSFFSCCVRFLFSHKNIKQKKKMECQQHRQQHEYAVRYVE